MSKTPFNSYCVNNNLRKPVLSKGTKRIFQTTRKASLSKSFMMASALPLGTLSSVALAATATSPSATANNQATQNAESAPVTKLDTITVTAAPQAEFKEDYLKNTKYTQALVDTPQTITVITDELLEEQKASTLIDALRNTPGITMQMGENANSTEGDAISMRGFSGNSLFLLDGVRNIGAVSRDTFNIETIEVTKGLAGAELGRGATGGAINQITKKPLSYTKREATLSVDTEAKTRVTADLNQPLNDDFDGRLNLMFEKGDAVERDEVDVKKYGIAPSIKWGSGTPTQVTASAQILRLRNTPETGIPTVGMSGFYRGPTNYTVDDLNFSQIDYSLIDASNPQEVVDMLNRGNALLNAAPKVDDKNYYGESDDYEDIDSDVYSLIIDHDFDTDLDIHLTNTTRFSKTDMDRRLSSPYNIFNNPLNIRRGPGNVLEVYEELVDANMDMNDPNTWRVSAIRQGVDRENKTLANLTNIRAC